MTGTYPESHPGMAADPTRPDGPMMDLHALRHLTAIPDKTPELTWIYQPSRRGDFQSAREAHAAMDGTSLQMAEHP